MINYIEITHEYSDDDGQYEDVYYAVCPTPDTYKFGNDERRIDFETGWHLMGTNLTLHGQQDVNGLRKLLDKIEEQLSSTE